MSRALSSAAWGDLNMTFAKFDAVGLVQLLEALYALEQPRAAWFRGVLKAASVAFDRGSGVGMLLYDVSGQLPRLDAIDGVNIEERNLEMAVELHRQPAFADAIRETYRDEVCATMAEHVRDQQMLTAARKRYAQVGLRDQVLINGANPSGFGCALYVFSDSLLALSDLERQLMTRVATHLAAAYRLQRRMDATGTRGIDGVDAVLHPSGRVAHAERGAASKLALRDLSDAVKQRESTRAAQGERDPHVASSAWKPLVSARWSLIDCYEQNGVRYVTARENTPAPSGLASLSTRERQVTSLAALGHSNKLVAYQLGLAHSTVRVLLARAAAKLGAQTRADVIQKVRTRAHDSELERSAEFTSPA
jgi:DNA-binding CsgD family transcriptional regulator